MTHLPTNSKYPPFIYNFECVLERDTLVRRLLLLVAGVVGTKLAVNSTLISCVDILTTKHIL